MTTIAFDGSLLCSDSLAVSDYRCQQDYQKIYLLPKGKYIAAAFSGSFNNIDQMIKWLMGDVETVSFGENSSVDCIAIDHMGRGWEIFSEMYGATPCGKFEACGSGNRFAMGAMAVGMTAYRAVEVGIQLDPNSGGPVQCYELSTGKLSGPFAVPEEYVHK